jgi:hypothetical protein
MAAGKFMPSVIRAEAFDEPAAGISAHYGSSCSEWLRLPARCSAWQVW